jgi:hypothetical protein
MQFTDITKRKRYFLSRRKGEWHVFDRLLDIRIARCDFREPAFRITSALNSQLEKHIEYATSHTIVELPLEPQDTLYTARVESALSPVVAALCTTTDDSEYAAITHAKC